MLLALIEGLRDQQRLRPSDLGFKTAAWNAVIPQIQAQNVKEGVTVRLPACKSKLSDLKALWQVWYPLT